jgi:SSS family solute:Na+ symporter
LVVKLGALVFILLAQAAGPQGTQFAIYFQLAGGVLIIQTLPAIFMALYLRWLDRWAVLAGWLVGIVSGIWMLYDGGFVGGALHALPGFGKAGIYIGLSSVLLNVVIVVVGSLLARVVAPTAERRTAMA